MSLQPLTMNRAAVCRPLTHDASPVAQVLATATQKSNKDPITITLDMFLESSRQMPAQSSMTISAARRTPDCSVTHSFAEYRALRTELQRSIQPQHCSHCEKLSNFLAHCWERPRLLTSKWNGGMLLNTDLLARFMKLLLEHVSKMDSNEPEACSAHADTTSILDKFLAPRADKDDE